MGVQRQDLEPESPPGIMDGHDHFFIQRLSQMLPYLLEPPVKQPAMICTVP
jgi:hypothetical protein